MHYILFHLGLGLGFHFMSNIQKLKRQVFEKKCFFSH